MSVRRFTLTEQVCLQTLLVLARRNGWQEWFSNPTAGPWKKVMIPGVGDRENIRFEKEEDRPDMIICSIAKRVMLVLEAKDDIRKLAQPAAITKYVSMFNSVKTRMTGILETHGDRLLGGRGCDTLVGYVFPSSDLDSPRVDELSVSHLTETRRRNLQQLAPHVLFGVSQASNGDLILSGRLSEVHGDLERRIREALPAVFDQ